MRLRWRQGPGEPALGFIRTPRTRAVKGSQLRPESGRGRPRRSGAVTAALNFPLRIASLKSAELRGTLESQWGRTMPDQTQEFFVSQHIESNRDDSSQQHPAPASTAAGSTPVTASPVAPSSDPTAAEIKRWRQYLADERAEA